jgi:hypothetical protein
MCATLLVARRQGCTCAPAITLTGEHPTWSATVAHDDWCPLFRALAERTGQTKPTGPIVVVNDDWKSDGR